MKYLIFSLFVFLAFQPSFASMETEAAQNFVVALKQGDDMVILIEKFKKIPISSPLRQWANKIAVEELGSQWLALIKSPGENK